MAVSVQDVLTPKGRLDPAIIWPGLSINMVQDKIRAFLTDGETRAAGAADEDVATVAWVYYRAYSEVYQRLALMPASVTDSDEGSSSYLQAQIEMVAALRDEALQEFEDETAEDEDEETYGTIQSYRD